MKKKPPLPHNPTLCTIPPTPISNQIDLEIRLSFTNTESIAADFNVVLVLNEEILLTRVFPQVTPSSTVYIQHDLSANDLGGNYILKTRIQSPQSTREISCPLRVVKSTKRSISRVDGAFTGFYHWSEQEGRLWNAELRKFNAQDWKALTRAQHSLGMNIIVPQESFRNEEYVGKHQIERDGYKGKAYYPSKLFTDRMDIACPDPLEAVLSEADDLGMFVFLPVGMYAWFDYTKGSLEWHKRVSSELWERYGHHKSFYGWYVSEEVHGNLGENMQRKQEIVRFFKEFKAHCFSMAPEKPVMFAPNCYDIRESIGYYRQLLPHLDIICPFGFHRMPDGDQSGEEAALLLQNLCDESGTHLWLDLEAFCFEEDMALTPRPIEGFISDFNRFPNFEKIICYQFPGLFNDPSSPVRPGGDATVRLFEDYRKYLGSLEER